VLVRQVITPEEERGDEAKDDPVHQIGQIEFGLRWTQGSDGTLQMSVIL
jgi:hypothetical protein